MAALTLQTLIIRARRMVAGGAGAEASGLFTSNLELLALHALAQIGSKISADPTRRHLLQKVYSVPLISGVGTLATSPDYDDMFRRSIPDGYVKDEKGNRFSFVNTLTDLEAAQPANYGYYTIANNSIYTRNLADGQLTTTQGPLSVLASFFPTAATVPAELVEETVELLAELIGQPAQGNTNA